MNRQILRLAIPNIISNLSVPLLGAVDTAVVGRLEHVYYLGAIAVGSIIFDFIFWGFGFLRMGTTGMVAQAYGEQNERKTRIILYRVLLVAAISSVFILLIQYPLIEASLYLVNASPEVEEYTRLYYHIRIFAAPATLALFGLNGWFLGMQNSTYPMIVTIFLNIVNIILNLIFVFRYNMTVDGVATGSLIASFLALGLAFILYRKKYGALKLEINWSELIEAEELRKFFSVNRDIVIRTLCLIFSYAFFTAKSAEMGDVVLAANTILLQMWYISSYGTDGFAYAAESLVGRFKGAKDNEQLKATVKANMLWGLGLGILGTTTYALLDTEIITLFTDKENVIAVAMTVVIWLIAAPVVNSVCFIWDGVYIGATSTGAMRNSMLVATILVFIPVYYISEPFAGIHALWMAMTAFMVARGVILSLYAPSRIFGNTESGI
ncbi:MAG TPA: MATE family efflux transporter [Gracilimonas sp.]|uniref:MATE family efflux transporter n=1 Tax=Gracilimonas sp. TaxID=1974203 RepID=UPI002D9E5482|nr:MATE family efflux transporter [Gracilimonas sp.]